MTIPHFENDRVFPVTVDVAAVPDGYAKLCRAGESRRDVVPDTIRSSCSSMPAPGSTASPSG